MFINPLTPICRQSRCSKYVYSNFNKDDANYTCKCLQSENTNLAKYYRMKLPVTCKLICFIYEGMNDLVHNSINEILGLLMQETLPVYYVVDKYLYTERTRENRQMGRPEIYISKEPLEQKTGNLQLVNSVFS